MSEKRLDTRWVGRKPLAIRMIMYFALRPTLGLGLYLLLAAATALAPSGSNLSAFYLLVFPWLFIVVFLMNMPLIGAAIRRFHLPEEVRVNHALEHGTIYFLRRRYGKKYKIGGRAEEDGFRLSGLPSDDQVVSSFAELREHLAAGKSRVVVSPRCGSMIVTAQGLAFLLLTLSVISFLGFHLNSRTKLGILGLVLLTYLLLRHGLGWLLQKHLFVSVDFTDARIQSIRRVQPKGPLERQHVYLVRTLVQRTE